MRRGKQRIKNLAFDSGQILKTRIGRSDKFSFTATHGNQLRDLQMIRCGVEYVSTTVFSFGTGEITRCCKIVKTVAQEKLRQKRK